MTPKALSRKWKPICSCSSLVPIRECMLHSCPCGCDMSIADNLYEYYHSDLRDRYTLEEYIIEEGKASLGFTGRLTKENK